MSGQVSYPSRNISQLKVEDGFLDQDEFEQMRFDLFNPPTPSPPQNKKKSKRSALHRTNLKKSLNQSVAASAFSY